MSKLWDKKEAAPNPLEGLVHRFTAASDRQFDNLLAYPDVLGSLAHVRMLEQAGIISPADAALLLPALERLLQTAAEGGLTVQEGVEDIHSQVELLLTAELGEAGKKIHAARSRNDQVLLDLKIFMRRQVRLLAAETLSLGETLLELSEQHAHVLLPGYTHWQPAMPSSFGLWFGAYAESVSEDLWALEAAYKLVNKNPLGSAAGYGSSFPIDRALTTKLLGFDSMHYNVVNAQMSRGKTEKAVAAGLAAIGSTLARLAADVVLYLCPNYGFMSFPAEVSTGSSIMPHKKNPDVFELMRARCNRLCALPNEIALITANLPSGYHRDLQLLKEHLFPAFADLRECLETARLVLPLARLTKGITDAEQYKYIFSVEEVNRRVLAGMPFRDAYREVGLEIEAGTFKAPEGHTALKHTHQGSMGNLCTAEIRAALQKNAAAFGDLTVW